LSGGLGFFVGLGLLAVLNDKASKVPFVSSKLSTFEIIIKPILLS